MLEKPIENKIIDFVRAKPRTVQEIALYIDRNWRTADRYIETIQKERGLIATRTFREGSRGALKVVYWNALDQAKGTAFQERLLQKILSGTKKEDFSPFDLYQFVPEDKRLAFIDFDEFIHNPDLSMNYDDLLKGTKQQALFFSGNLSWMQLGKQYEDAVEHMAKNNVRMKILTRIDITSQKMVEKILALNVRFGKDLIEIRHCEQPVRAVIIDDTLASFKEVFTAEQHREMKKKTFMFYRITDPEWINWLQKVFWHLWEPSIDAKTRLDALSTLKPNKVQ